MDPFTGHKPPIYRRYIHFFRYLDNCSFVSLSNEAELLIIQTTMAGSGGEEAVVSAHDWVRGITFSILASMIGGASKLSIRKSCEFVYVKEFFF